MLILPSFSIDRSSVAQLLTVEVDYVRFDILGIQECGRDLHVHSRIILTICVTRRIGIVLDTVDFSPVVFLKAC